MDMQSFFDHGDTSHSSTGKKSTSSTTVSTSHPNPCEYEDQEEDEDECWSCPCIGCKGIQCGTRDIFTKWNNQRHYKVEQCHNHGGWGWYMCKTCKLCLGSNVCCTCAGNFSSSTFATTNSRLDLIGSSEAQPTKKRKKKNYSFHIRRHIRRIRRMHKQKKKRKKKEKKKDDKQMNEIIGIQHTVCMCVGCGWCMCNVQQM